MALYPWMRYSGDVPNRVCLLIRVLHPLKISDISKGFFPDSFCATFTAFILSLFVTVPFKRDDLNEIRIFSSCNGTITSKE